MKRRHWSYNSAMLVVFALLIAGTVYFASRPPRPTVDLSTAMSLNYYDEIEKNLKYGTDVNASANGMTPLFVAVGGHYPLKIIKELIAAGADTNLPVRDSGERPLHVAALNPRLDVVRALLDAGADVNAGDKNGTTPLMDAAASGQVQIVRLLLQRGAHVDSRDARGWSALCLAAESQQTETMQALLDGGANVNSSLDGKGNFTALKEARFKGLTKSVAFLLAHGARD